MNRRLRLIFLGFYYFLRGFFPVELFLLQLRRSLLMVAFWFLLMAMSAGWVLDDYGINQLFMEPEYLGKTGWLAYFIVGLTLGLFTMAFHIATYIFYSYRYPFLATLRRPLYRFAFNNSVFPFLFYAVFLWQLWHHHRQNGWSGVDFVLDGLALIGGAIAMVLLSFAYFFGALRNEESVADTEKPKGLLSRMFQSPEGPTQPKNKVTTYLRNFVSIRLVRPTSHYPDEKTRLVLQRHHRFAFVFFLGLFIGILVLGWFGTLAPMRIPAGATIVLLFALYLMVTGGAFVFARTWNVTFILLVLLTINMLSSWGFLGKRHPVYGLDYDRKPVAYSADVLLQLQSDSLRSHDMEQAEGVLDTWKAGQASKKPVMVVLNASGGGLRAAYWTGLVMQRVDSALGASFYPRVHFMAGSSGGAIGLAYYRALKQQHEGLPGHAEIEHLSADLLNPVGFTWITSDLFFGSGYVTLNGREYPKDRGFAFETALDENTGGLLAKDMAGLTKDEVSATIPRLMLMPTILNDGRQLLISPVGSSYLTASRGNAFGERANAIVDAVEARSLLKSHGFGTLRLLSALRTSATFPFVTPLANLPTDPPLQLMDAGVRDNEGTMMVLRYLFAHRTWIRENVSAVIFVSAIASRPPGPRVFYTPHRSYSRELTDPIVGVVRTFSNLQYYHQATTEMFLNKQVGVPMYLVRFNLLESDEGASLSWHLTGKEKKEVRKALLRTDNVAALDSLSSIYQKAVAPPPR